MTPLHSSGLNDAVAVASFLIERDPELVRITDKDACSVLHYACSVVDLLLDTDSELVFLTDSLGRSALYMACKKMPTML